MLSQSPRRCGVRRPMLAMGIALVLSLCFAAPAFASSTGSVRIRVEGANGALYDSVQTVGPTTFADSSGAAFSPTVSPTPVEALDIAARLGGFPFFVTDYGSALFVSSVNNELPGPGPDYDGWGFRINGSQTRPGALDDYYTASGVALRAGDEVLWYYGAWDAVPTRAFLPAKAVSFGSLATIVAQQLDVHGASSALASAGVHVGSRIATSGPDGTARMPMTQVGDFGVRVQKDGYIRSAIETLHVRYATRVSSLAASKKRIRRGTRVTLSGAVSAAAKVPARRTVTLQSHKRGSTVWKSAAHTASSASGTFRFSVKPGASTYYRATFAGDSEFAAVASAARLITLR